MYRVFCYDEATTQTDTISAVQEVSEGTRAFYCGRPKNGAGALAQPVIVEHLIVSQSWKNENANTTFDTSAAEVISDKEYKPLSNFTTPPGILAVARIPENTPASFEIEELVLVLDGVSDPGNMGTIIRTAEWFGGVQAIICSADSTDVWQPKVVQASMGSVFRLPVLQADLTLFFLIQWISVFLFMVLCSMGTTCLRRNTTEIHRLYWLLEANHMASGSR